MSLLRGRRRQQRASYLRPWSEQDIVMALPSQTVRSDKSNEEPHGSRVKAPSVPLEGRANCSHEAAELGTEQNTFTKPIIAKHLPVVA